MRSDQPVAGFPVIDAATIDDAAATLHALTPEAMQSLQTMFSPASLFGFGGVTTPATSGGGPGFPNARVPTMGPCVNGSMTATFPAGSGAPPIPPMRIPCTAAPAVHR